jgi:hypothetical protein
VLTETGSNFDGDGKSITCDVSQKVASEPPNWTPVGGSVISVPPGAVRGWLSTCFPRMRLLSACSQVGPL